MGCPRRTPWTVLRTPVCCCLLSTSFTSVSIFSVCCNSSVSISVPGTYLCWKLPEQGPVPTSAGNYRNRARYLPLLETARVGARDIPLLETTTTGVGTDLCWKTTRTWARYLPLLENHQNMGPVPSSAGKPPEHGPGTYLCWKPAIQVDQALQAPYPPYRSRGE
jgi:hypothetical protein